MHFPSVPQRKATKLKFFRFPVTLARESGRPRLRRNVSGLRARETHPPGRRVSILSTVEPWLSRSVVRASPSTCASLPGRLFRAARELCGPRRRPGSRVDVWKACASAGNARTARASARSSGKFARIFEKILENIKHSMKVDGKFRKSGHRAAARGQGSKKVLRAWYGIGVPFALFIFCGF